MPVGIEAFQLIGIPVFIWLAKAQGSEIEFKRVFRPLQDNRLRGLHTGACRDGVITLSERSKRNRRQIWAFGNAQRLECCQPIDAAKVQLAASTFCIGARVELIALDAVASVKVSECLCLGIKT